MHGGARCWTLSHRKAAQHMLSRATDGGPRSRQGAREATAGCDSFGSLIMKSLTAVTTSSQADLAFVAGVKVKDWTRVFLAPTLHGTTE